MEKTGVPRENHRPITIHWQNFITYWEHLAMSGMWTHNFSGAYVFVNPTTIQLLRRRLLPKNLMIFLEHHIWSLSQKTRKRENYNKKHTEKHKSQIRIQKMKTATRNHNQNKCYMLNEDLCYVTHVIISEDDAFWW